MRTSRSGMPPRLDRPMSADPATIHVIAPLRISFVGGGTDFPHYFEEHGGAVLSVTIDHHVRVTIAPRDDRQVIVRSLDLGHLVEYHLDAGPVYDGVMDLAKAAIDRIGVPCGIEMDIDSDAPAGQRPRRLVGAGDRRGRRPRHARRATARRARAGPPLLFDRTRRPGDQRRLAGSVRRRVRRLQPVRVLAAGCAGLPHPERPPRRSGASRTTSCSATPGSSGATSA